MNKLLKALVETPCVPQLQDRMLKLIQSEVKFAKVETDGLGNIKLAPKGKSAKDVTLLAHLNEIGFTVEHIDDNGFLRFGTGSKVDERSLLGQRMLIHTGKGDVRSVIGAMPPHLLEREEAGKPAKLEHMFLDVGASSKKSAEEMGIQLGDPITLEGQLRELPDGRFVGKALDDRAGCAVLIEALGRLAKSRIQATGWLLAQESTFPRDFSPGSAIAVDATLAGPYPIERVRVERHALPVELGKGPALTLQEDGTTIGQSTREALDKAAKTAKVELQIEASSRADAERVNPMKCGVPSAILSLPVKYVRTPGEIISGEDMEAAVKVLQRFVKAA